MNFIYYYNNCQIISLHGRSNMLEIIIYEAWRCLEYFIFVPEMKQSKQYQIDLYLFTPICFFCFFL